MFVPRAERAVALLEGRSGAFLSRGTGNDASIPRLLENPLSIRAPWTPADDVPEWKTLLGA